MIYLRNLNHSRRIVVCTVGTPVGRVIPPGATTGMVIDPDILVMPAIQTRLAQARVAVLDRGAWCADLRQRRAGLLNWQELIARAERAAMDRLRQLRPAPDSYAVRCTKPRKHRADESPPERTALLLQRWGEGATAAQIARELGRSVHTVYGQLRRAGAAPRYRRRNG